MNTMYGDIWEAFRKSTESLQCFGPPISVYGRHWLPHVDNKSRGDAEETFASHNTFGENWKGPQTQGLFHFLPTRGHKGRCFPSKFARLPTLLSAVLDIILKLGGVSTCRAKPCRVVVLVRIKS